MEVASGFYGVYERALEKLGLDFGFQRGKQL